MGDVLTFTPRPKPAAPEILEPLAGAALRASLEEAAQTALDAADRIIAVLDRMDGDADHKDGGDAKPSLAAPENTAGSQVTWLRGNDQDREAEAAETVLPEVAVVIEVEPSSWGGRGNVVAAAGVALLEMVVSDRCSDRHGLPAGVEDGFTVRREAPVCQHHAEASLVARTVVGELVGDQHPLTVIEAFGST
ncbi:hypothetical protein FOHLNKBM_4344 [Methylobacterium longum]|nr:hypothetical protein FOHLNKBM_4344 [Methylobacterium longum]